MMPKDLEVTLRWASLQKRNGRNEGGKHLERKSPSNRAADSVDWLPPKLQPRSGCSRDGRDGPLAGRLPQMMISSAQCLLWGSANASGRRRDPSASQQPPLSLALPGCGPG